MEIAVKISARNILKGKIVEVKKGTATAHVRIDAGGQIVTASITNEAVGDLKLTAGQNSYAVIKPATRWWASTSPIGTAANGRNGA
jgi:molybdopterin-binding protein